jgi:hypothetical protein
MAQNQNIPGSTNIIMEIMNDPERTQDETYKYNQIYQNARIYYENHLNKTKPNYINNNPNANNFNYPQQTPSNNFNNFNNNNNPAAYISNQYNAYQG